MADILLAGVVLAAVVIGILVGFLAGAKLARAKMENVMVQEVESAREDTKKRQRATIGGKLMEKLAPYLPDFPYDPTDLRFIGDPIDFVLFRGLAQGNVEEVVFIEVKSGKSRLKGRQSQIQAVIEAGRIGWRVIQVGGP